MFTLICTDIEFLVQIRDKVIEEISSFFSSFSLRRLDILESFSDISAKEEQILAWAETDSLQTAMREHRLEWTRPCSSQLFEGAIVQRGAVISRSHPRIKSTCWIRQLILLNGSWTVLHGSDKWVLGTYNLCTDIVAVGPVVDRSAVPKRILNVVQHRIQVEGFCDFFVKHAHQSISSDSSTESIEYIRVTSPDAIPNFSRSSSSSSQSENLNYSKSSSSSDSPMHFTADDILEIPSSDDVLPDEETSDVQISLPTAGVPSTEYTEAVAQLRATFYHISIEKVQTRFHLDELKATLFKNISSLETAFLTTSDNQDRVVLALTNVLRKEMQAQKYALSKELDAMRKEIQDQKAAIMNDLLEFRVEAQENFQTLSAHLAELIAYINRVRDDKKGELSSSRGPQPPDDRSRPGPGDSGRGRGSRSEPPRKRGGSTSSRGFRY
ncbi:227 kDa spindle- and centromere-associated protein [Dorcoceras hygrometricum]|uniref:227 kDa spindle-and centromere-associated protein n=1 Tax=Dorcoceras hygrometricum TaxID=472368 RepID=A0A2Z7C3P0_9LAMI|nr:227 kDa spindle- and centromere-associated protein [Dorcoceras hygrometricum]